MDRVALLKDLQRQVKVLEEDLRERAGHEEFDARLRGEWQAAKDAKRVARAYEVWLEDQVTQAAVAWVLGTVFVRFCEDNALVDEPWIAEAESGTERATDRQGEYYAKYPTHTARDWLLVAFRELGEASTVTAGLFDERYNPLWTITPSEEAARGLIGFWRMPGEGGKGVRHDFRDGEWDTRFLGDLYQDLSEAVREQCALLQTPKIVEKFILELTLEPTIDEFGLEPEYPGARAGVGKGLRLIDPACGSGHFLLGAFHYLLKAWEYKAEGLKRWERWEVIRRVLDGVHGVDKNPFAVAIARFRLMLAAMKEAQEEKLADAPNFEVYVAVGDSLIHGRGAPRGEPGEKVHVFSVEDILEKRFVDADVLGRGSYHAVVGNPPYITVKDPHERDAYRKRYKDVCRGKYALSVPFAALFFQLAARGDENGDGAGHVGQIIANSFMKREFGRDLIEKFFARQVSLTHIVDTSGAYIPGHGTPTVVLIGRNVLPRGAAIRAVLGIRGEPERPKSPEEGLVWRAIDDQVHKPGSESPWVSVVDVERGSFADFPWSLGGGGAVGVMDCLSSSARARLVDSVHRIGVFGMTNADDVMIAPLGAWRRRPLGMEMSMCLVVGDNLRDWVCLVGARAFFPYSSAFELLPIEVSGRHHRWLWPARTTIGDRQTFNRVSYVKEGRPWYEWHQVTVDPGGCAATITLAFVATHNHFVLDHGGRVFNRSAPVIKLPEGATEERHLELLGLLNSSIACFWLKQVSQSKGNGGIGGGISDELWEHRFEFAGTKLQECPLPSKLPLELGRLLDSLAQELAANEPSAICASSTPTRVSLAQVRAEHTRIRARMIALQEELDWQVYGLYDLIPEPARSSYLSPDLDAVPGIALGERAFEIVLARKMAAGEAETQWFARHHSTPLTEIPVHWPDWYRDLVQRRIDLIESNAHINLIERPEYKRRWATDPWDKKEHEALRSWLLDACEDRSLWFDASGFPAPLTVNQLADKLRADPDVVSVAQLYAGADTDLAAVLTEITETEHVPYLSALRYKESGLRKRAQWERTWDLQREEDSTGERLDIDVPPKYASGDYLKVSYWRQRGKLDVPKERFISYPAASPGTDPSMLLGWAGWDHRQAAHALVVILQARSAEWADDAARLTPLVAGLAEVMPWVRQWHQEIDPEFGASPAQVYGDFLATEQQRLGLPDDVLLSWRPTPTARGRRKQQ